MVMGAAAHTCGGGWSAGPAEFCFSPAACAQERESPSRDISARRTLQNEKKLSEGDSAKRVTVARHTSTQFASGQLRKH